MQQNGCLRDDAYQWLDRAGNADILIGIPSYQSGKSIEHVVKAVGEGLIQYFPTKKSAILVSDGGSVDDAREKAAGVLVPRGIHRHVTIYRGLPGKGTALRAVFVAADMLDAEACAVFDSDLRSITPEWVLNCLEPVLGGEYDYVTPYYLRYKLDGTITNQIVYPFTRMLFGRRIRQPIGGDFGFSRSMVDIFLQEKEEMWKSHVARFGIDIWMTTRALEKQVRICQTRLGAKLHDPKDPSALGGMLRDVVSTLFTIAARDCKRWDLIQGSTDVPIVGKRPPGRPRAFEIDREFLLRSFVMGLRRFRPVWRSIVGGDAVRKLMSLPKRNPDRFLLPFNTWAKIVCDFALAFRYWDIHRHQLIDFMEPLYFGQIVSFANHVRDLSDKVAETKVEEMSEAFERQKRVLVRKWTKPKSDTGMLRFKES